MEGIPFTKYHGCGNDFIIVEDSKGQFTELFQNADLVKRFCDRNFGVGADGMLHILSHEKYDFDMQNYAARFGLKSRLCGNATRCAVHFAKESGIINKNSGVFFTRDGPHDYSIDGATINVKINDVLRSEVVRINDDEFYLNVGSPHHVKFIRDVGNYDVMGEGREICNSVKYKDPESVGNSGVNVNFAEIKSKNEARLQTFERSTITGESKACGTGSVSTAIAMAIKEGAKQDEKHRKLIANPGGSLVISFTVNADRFSDVVMSGPAEKVFTGTYFIHKQN